MRAGFPHSEILGSKLACQLPEAYRRLQRPSSPVVAKASTTCTCSLDPITLSIARKKYVNDALRASAARCKDLSGRAWRRRGRLSRDTNTANAISYPDESGLRKPDSLHFFRIFKEQPNNESPNVRVRTLGHSSRTEMRILVEPTGIEPVTSCLQSRRSPS